MLPALALSMLALNATLAPDAGPVALTVGIDPAAEALAELGLGSAAGSGPALLFSVALPGPGAGLGGPTLGSALEAATPPVSYAPRRAPSGAPPTPGAVGAAVVAAAGAAAASAWWPWLRLAGAGILAPLYSRLQRDDMMKNEVRARLYEAVKAEPGLSMQDLGTRGGAGWGTTVYHLQRLEQEGLVRSQRVGHARRFFAVGDVDRRDQDALGLLKNDTTVKIATFLLDSPGASQTDVCRALGLSPSLAHKYLSRMEAADMLTKEREWRTVRYTPKERMGALVTAGAASDAPARA